MLFCISIILLVITLIGLWMMIGCWVYKDSKLNSEKPFTWTVIALIVPNLFGVLIYLLVGRQNKQVKQKNKFKVPLIAFIIGSILSVSLFLGNVILSDNLPILNRISIGMVNNNIGEKWFVSFKTSGEELSRNVKLSDEQLNQFRVEGKCNEGKLYLLIVQNDTSQVIDISNFPETTIDLSKYKSGNVKLMLYNEDARNANVRIVWSDLDKN